MKLTSIAFAGLIALATATPSSDYEDGKPKPPGPPPGEGGYPPYPPPPPPHGKPPPPPPLPDHGKPPPPPPDHGAPPPPPPPHGKPSPPDHATSPSPPPPPPPPPPGGRCTPGTYSCATNPQTGGPGWQVCNVSGQYEYGGDCPPNTVCKFFEPSKSPYCVPPNYNFP